LAALTPSLILSEGVAAVYALRFGVRGVVEKFRGSLSGAFVQVPGYVADRSIVSVTQARVPFELLSSSPVIRLIGKAVNALYVLNARLFKSLFQ
jgi:hypothetical protein